MDLIKVMERFPGSRGVSSTFGEDTLEGFTEMSTL